MRLDDQLTAEEQALGTAVHVAFEEITLTPAQRRLHLERLEQRGRSIRVTRSIDSHHVAWASRAKSIVTRRLAPSTTANSTRHSRLTRAFDGAALVLILLLFAIGALLARALMPGQGSSPTSELTSAPKLSTIYAVQEDASGESLRPLDSTTLADQPGGPVIPQTPDWAISSDGSTVVTIEYSQGVPIIVVRDGFSGPVRNRVSLPVSGLIGTIELNRDGSHMLVNRQLQPSQWSVIDLTSGKLLMSLDTKSPTFGFDTPMGAESVQLSPDGTRLYRFVFTDRADASGPQPLRVIEYDASNGQQLGTMTYGTIQVGTWQIPGATEADSVAHVLQPGIAFAPNGRQIAIVNPDGQAITLLDAEKLTRERTITVSQPTSFIDRALSALGIEPRPVAAKEIDGSLREAIFSADGRSLYTWGDFSTTASTNGMQGLGLTRVDLANGASTQSSPGALIAQVQPSPDGMTLYVTGSIPTTGSVTPPHFIQRLDPQSLQTLAERSLSDVYSFVLVAQR